MGNLIEMTDSHLAKLRILIVEDDPPMRIFIRQTLEAFGVSNIEEAGNGVEALEHLHQPGSIAPDIIISDLHMDELDGIGLCKSVRRDKSPNVRGIPILILTGDEDPHIHKVAEQVGAASVLTKPVSATELFHGISRTVRLSA
jgi:CheY-like chemotaxis protein